MIHESQALCTSPPHCQIGFDWWRITISLCPLVDLGSVLNKNVVTRRPIGMLSEFSLFGFMKVAKQ